LQIKTFSFISPFLELPPNHHNQCKSRRLSWDRSLHDKLSDAVFPAFSTFTPEAELFGTSSDSFSSRLFCHRLVGALFSLSSLSGTPAKTVKTKKIKKTVMRRENWDLRVIYQILALWLFPFFAKVEPPGQACPQKVVFGHGSPNIERLWSW
jgi:hypothetical protein